jgi:hypothetical protein
MLLALMGTGMEQLPGAQYEDRGVLARAVSMWPDVCAPHNWLSEAVKTSLPHICPGNHFTLYNPFLSFNFDEGLRTEILNLISQ